MFKKQNGITLVALVVTIVVLLILAGVSLSLVLGQNGIVTKAKQAGQDYGASQEEENKILANAEYYVVHNEMFK